MPQNPFFALGDDSGDIVGQIVGDDFAGDEMSGDDTGDIVGDIVGAMSAVMAKHGRGRHQHSHHPMRHAGSNLGRKVDYTGFKPNAVRQQPIGVYAQIAAGPGTQGPATNNPQVPFKLERVLIPSSIGSLCAVQDILVGNVSQLGASGILPGLMFSEQAVGVKLSCRTAYISQAITVQVLNLANSVLFFNAGLIGTSVVGSLVLHRENSTGGSPRCLDLDFA